MPELINCSDGQTVSRFVEGVGRAPVFLGSAALILARASAMADAARKYQDIRDDVVRQVESEFTCPDHCSSPEGEVEPQEAFHWTRRPEFLVGDTVVAEWRLHYDIYVKCGLSRRAPRGADDDAAEEPIGLEEPPFDAAQLAAETAAWRLICDDDD